ncbi:MAG: CHAT domain-containing protein [Rhodospirillaceae bacterium]
MTMNSQVPIINISGDHEETILRLARHLGRDKNRRSVFNLIYGRGSKPRSKKQIADSLGVTGNAQVIQNALDELAKHHLIVRIKNEGQVKDGSRWIYEKDSSVRANRSAILKFADNPDAAKKVATKRRPAIETNLSFVKPTKRTARPRGSRPRRGGKQARLKIALLVTNPDSRASIQTGIEARYIDEGIRLESKAGEVELKIIPAPTLNTLIDTLNSYHPDIIHFSGHGGGQALLFDNERAGDDGGTALDFDMIARVIGATSIAPKLLVLAACDTADGADRFLDTVPVVIAMADTIDDEAACEFSGRFYRSLSAGATIAHSLDQAKLILESKGYEDANLPSLVVRDAKVSQHAFL